MSHKMSPRSGFIGKNLIKQINAEYQVYDIVKSDKNFNYSDVRMGIKISSNFQSFGSKSGS